MARGKVVNAAAEHKPSGVPVVQWDKVKGLERTSFDTLLEQRRAFNRTIEDTKKKIASINNKLMGSLMAVDVKSVAVGEAKVTLVPAGKTTKFDRDIAYARLLELGVKPVVVAKAYKDATSHGDREAYILVTEPKTD